MASDLFKVETLNDVCVLTLTIGEFLHDENEHFKAGFEEILTQGHKKIVLDLTETNYVSSLILASLVYIHQRAKTAGGDLILCNIKDRVQEILSMTNLDKVFHIKPTKDDAVKEFQK